MKEVGSSISSIREIEIRCWTLFQYINKGKWKFNDIIYTHATSRFFHDRLLWRCDSILITEVKSLVSLNKHTSFFFCYLKRIALNAISTRNNWFCFKYIRNVCLSRELWSKTIHYKHLTILILGWIVLLIAIISIRFKVLSLDIMPTIFWILKGWTRTFCI